MFNNQFAKIPSSEDEFRRLILAVSMASMKINTFSDNYDWDRFGRTPDSKSTEFAVSERVMWLEWFFEHCTSIYQAMTHLADDKSKSLMMNLLAYRIAGHLSIKIDVDFSSKNSQAFKEFSGIATGPSGIEIDGRMGPLSHFDFSHKGHYYRADALDFSDTLFRGQYCLYEGTIKVMVEERDVVIDGGACLGESSIVFGKATGPSGTVYAFDPISEHLNMVKHNAALNPDCNIVAMPFGLSDQDFDCEPLSLGKYDPAFSLRRASVPLRKLDSLIISGEIQKVDLIKLDVEGAELQALKGAMHTLSTFRPKLAISLYHLPTDIFSIPIWIKDNFPFYKMHMRHYTMHREETVLYCSANA